MTAGKGCEDSMNRTLEQAVASSVAQLYPEVPSFLEVVHVSI
jgi:hypothetical protein